MGTPSRKKPVADRRTDDRREVGRRTRQRPITPQTLVKMAGASTARARKSVKKMEQAKQTLGLSIKDMNEKTLEKMRPRFANHPEKSRLLDWVIKELPHHRIVLRQAGAYGVLKKRALLQDPGFPALKNREAFRHGLLQMVRTIERKRGVCSLATIDLDWFSNINNTYGHHVGDEVIREAAHHLADFAKKNGGVAGRVGGEEIRIAVPLPGWHLAQKLEKVQRTFEAALRDPTKLRNPEGGKLTPHKGWSNWRTPTFSVGISERKGRARETGIPELANQLEQESDQALYKAKENRGSVWRYGQPGR